MRIEFDQRNVDAGIVGRWERTGEYAGGRRLPGEINVALTIELDGACGLIRSAAEVGGGLDDRVDHQRLIGIAAVDFYRDLVLVNVVAGGEFPRALENPRTFLRGFRAATVRERASYPQVTFLRLLHMTLKHQPNARQIGMRSRDEVVFKLPLMTVVHNINPRINAAEPHTGVVRNALPPLPAVASHEVVAGARQEPLRLSQDHTGALHPKLHVPIEAHSRRRNQHRTSPDASDEFARLDAGFEHHGQACSHCHLQEKSRQNGCKNAHQKRNRSEACTSRGPPIWNAGIRPLAGPPVPSPAESMLCDCPN